MWKSISKLKSRKTRIIKEMLGKKEKLILKLSHTNQYRHNVVGKKVMEDT